MSTSQSTKLAFIDLETTGLDPQRHAIIQIGMILDIEGILSEHEWHLRPFGGALIDPTALEVHGLAAEEIATYPDPAEIHRAICMELSAIVGKYNKRDKLFLIGFNSWFDYQFLRQMFTRCGDHYFGSYFHWPPIDVAGTLAMSDPQRWSQLSSRKLSNLAIDYLDPECELTFHDAMDDIRATRMLWQHARRKT